MRRFVLSLPFVLMAVLLLTGVVSCEVSLWRECRADHSFFYCMRVLGK